MSIAAMNWAWGQKLKPTPKLILMALADAANECGICWPSVSTLADKCCVSMRTVRRVMRKLIERRLLLAEQRYRRDGSCSSNRYRLKLEGGDRLSPPPVAGDTIPGQRCEGPRDASVIPGTTSRTVKEPQPPQGTAASVLDTEAGDSGSGELSGLVFPRALTATEQEEAGRKLAGLSAGLAQQLLDELAASIGTNVIQKTPLAYLRGLIARARAGAFSPEGALRVAGQRRQQAKVDAAIARDNSARTHYPPAVVDPDHPLLRRLHDIQNRYREKERQSD
jgi:Helix-turn-helix domain